MKKRFLLTFLIVFFAMGINAFAKTYEVSFKEPPKFLVVSEYSDGLICNMKIFKSSENTIKFDTDATEFSSYLVYETKIEETKANEVTKEDNKEKFPSVYEKEKDANRAVIVVDSVLESLIDGEKKISVNAFFHGEKITLNFDEAITLKNVPDAALELKDVSIKSLKKGDVIKVSVLFGGFVDSVSLLFRPPTQNPLINTIDFGTGFYKLFSNSGIVAGEYKAMTPKTDVLDGYAYAFGVITESYDNGFVLMDQNGDMLDIDLAEGAVIYDIDRKEDFKVSKSSVGAIRRGQAVRKSFDEDDNFLGWTKEAGYNFAFLRTIDKDATEVVIYKNY